MDIRHPMSDVSLQLLTLVIAAGVRIKLYNNNLFTSEQDNVEETKLDGTPVTALDKDINSVFAQFAEQNSLGFIGEEGNGDFSNKRYVLLVDPIDGTAAFVRGMNTATIIVTVMEMKGNVGIPVISFIHEPLRGITWIGALDQPTQIMRNGVTTGIPRLSDQVAQPIRAYICSFPGASHNLAKVKAAIETDRAFSHQELGGFGISAGLIASRIIHAAAIGTTSAVEAAAMKLVVEGAGGIAISLEGRPISFFRIGTVRGKVDFMLPQGALFATNMATARKVQRHIMEANVR